MQPVLTSNCAIPTPANRRVSWLQRVKAQNSNGRQEKTS